MRPIFFICMISTLLFASCNNADETTTSGDAPEITIEVVREFSEDPDNEDSWMTRVGSVQLDTEGNVFLREYERGLILKYNADGTFNQIIGRKGKGPGEYENVTMFKVDEDSLYIFDRNSQKMLVYHSSGADYRTIQLEESIMYPDLHPTEYGFAAIQNLSFFSGQDEPVAYAYDHNLNKISTDELMLSDLYGEFYDDDMTMLAGSSPANYVMPDDYTILAAPTVYFGEIYELKLNRETMTWSKTDTLYSEPVNELYKEVGPDDRGDFRLFLSTSNEPQVFQIFSKSSEILITDEGQILNFRYYDSAEQRLYGVEVFDRDYEYTGFDTLTVDSDLEDKERVYFIKPGDHMNSSYYRTLEKEDGSYVVQEFRLNIE